VEYEVNGIIIWSARPQSGGAGEPFASRWVANNSFIAGSGPHEVRVKLDPSDVVAESFEIDNEAHFAFTPVSPRREPAVTRVFVDGTGWSPSFRDHLQRRGLGSARYGFAVAHGAGQLAAMPWGNADSITVQFNHDVSVQEADLVVRGGTDGMEYAFRPGTFRYDSVRYTATWTLDKPIANFPALRPTGDAVRLELDGGEPDGVRLAAGEGLLLDGEWTDGAETASSGDGEAGGDFCMRLNVVPGDANRNGNVGPTDFGMVRSGVGRGVGDVGAAPREYSAFKDVNGDGAVSPADLGMVRGNMAGVVPAAAPVARIARRETEAEELFGGTPIL
jgi:hypothetical protein